MKNQNFPLINVVFCMTSDFTDLQKINKALSLTPSKYRKKNEWPQASIKAGIACDTWEIETEQTTSKNVNLECKKIMAMLKGKENAIKSLCKEYNMKTHVEVVIHTKSTETPAIYLDEEIVTFLSMINADIGFDIYAYDEENESE